MPSRKHHRQHQKKEKRKETLPCLSALDTSSAITLSTSRSQDTMDTVFGSVLETITELSTIHALQHLKPIWTGVDKRLQKLQYSLLLIQPLVEDAEERQLTDQAIRCWLLLLKDAVYDAEDILDEANTHELLIQRKAELSGRPRSKVREFFSLGFNPLLFKLQLGKKLRNINERINDLIEEMGKFKLRVLENNSRPLKNRPQTYSYLHESRVIIGRDEDKEKLVQMLISDCFDEKMAVVSVIGMGGLGKTTLAQLVYGDQRVKKQFELCIWVCVSDDFDVAKLAGKIMHTAPGENCDHTNMEVLQQMLRKELGQKRYLLVLDDVWNEDFQKWDDLRNMLLDGGEGSRILVTTRNEKCSRVMGAQKHHILRGLSEKSSWALFEQKAFAVGAQRPPKLVEIGKKIVKKCQGLPLAIEVLGCIMHYKSDEGEWQAVLENIETWKLQHTKYKIMPELWLSYADLPTHLKKCFAFCAIFPKDHDLEEVELIQFWMAHGFIAYKKGNNMEVEGQEIFTELIRRSLLQNKYSVHAINKGRVCTMHDLIHDLAHFVMENECFTSFNSSAAPEIPIRPRQLNLYSDKNYNQADCSTIRTVLNCQCDSSVLSRLKFVRVLDLSYTHINELPASIEHLYHLRYLDISGTHIRKVPDSICMLVNLRTLKLYCCFQLSELPKSITYMNSLRHLYFDYELLKIFPGGLSQLQNLKTLNVYTVGDDAENNIGQLKSLNPFGELTLYNLQKVKNADDARKADMGNKQLIQTLQFNWRNFSGKYGDEYCLAKNAEEVLEALKPPSGIKELTVRYYPGKQFPMWMGEMQQFQYLHRIILFKCEACEQLPPLEILPCLEFLAISQMDGIKHILNNSRGNALQSFPALKQLRLYGMKNLEGWCVEEGKEANLSLFPCLTQMEITTCPKLTTMPSIPTLQMLAMKQSFCETQISLVSKERRFFKHLESLQSLTINSCPDELVSLLEDEEETRAMKSSLEWLDIDNCNQLSLALVFQNLPSLRELVVGSFEKLVSWPDEIQSLKFLNDLTISSCKNFTGVSSQGDFGPPFLKSLHVSGSDALRELPTCPTSLQSLSILNCRGIKSLWPEIGHLTSLSILQVSRCPNLVSLSDVAQGLTSLQYLIIEDCPALKSFQEGLQQLLPALKSLKIRECPELERLCKPGGDYYDLLPTILYKEIGAESEETTQIPHEISTGAKQALKCIATNRFLLSAIFICAIAYFLYNLLDSQVPISPFILFFVFNSLVFFGVC
ncbi:P-loop containing nucleoside triphosphate hydrolase protein [Dioscorea alata]|uniref:P-loop containing nucleoside triphosphate hydrolase protein n=1 Tax=Dioscorea alata TaxID=55571 RepID=A0ACB7VSH9_DIOAL|nr:P-loop containing nucleoside triphosphate hydrolase protein [Dioscorea alata]